VSRGIVAIALVAGFLLSYLCILVRVSALDVRCYRLQAKCDEVWGAIANDQTELSAQDDLATNLDVAAANGLQPVAAHEKVVVSADLLPVRAAEGEPTDLDRVRERPSLARLR
jgi:hypothetical protein